MNPQDRYLIAIDLDDTVLSDLLSLDAKSVQTLMDAQDAGHIVMIATARPSCIALPYYRIMGMNTLMSVMCGCYTYHPDGPDAPSFRHTMDAPLAADVVNTMQTLGMEHIWMGADDDIYSQDGVMPDHPYWRMMFRASNVHVSAALPAVECGRVYALAHTQEQVDAFRAKFGGNEALRLAISHPKEDVYHVHAWSGYADKWYGVQEAAEYYGIRPENILCFGDERIDYKMTANAAHGYVMCNGLKAMIDEAREQGRGVTTYPCGQDGVGYEVRRILKL